MGWTTPKTWNVDELVTAAMMNTHLRDNMNYLFSPNRQQKTGNANYSTTSTSFVDVDSSNLSFSLETYGGPVLVWAMVACKVSTSGAYIGLDVEVDGTRLGAGYSSGLAKFASIYTAPVTIFRVVELSAGTHTFKLQWRVSGGTGYIYGGSTNAQAVFGAMEI